MPVFSAERERQTPLDAQPFTALVDLALACHAYDQRVLRFRLRADFVHAREHVAQLVGEGVVGVIHRHSRPVGHGEIRAQQLAGGAFVAAFAMFRMSREHPPDDHVLFGAIEQFRQRQAGARAHGGHDAERDRGKRGDRAGLRHRRQFVDHPVSQCIGDLPAGNRHHRRGVSVPLHRGDQHTQREFGLAAAGGARHQRGLREIIHIHHGFPAYPTGAHRIRAMPSPPVNCTFRTTVHAPFRNVRFRVAYGLG